jgi:GT2 family glycosyltransferase
MVDCEAAAGTDTAPGTTRHDTKLAVIIPTLGRRDSIRDVIGLLASQTRRPDEVIISAPAPEHVVRISHDGLRVAYAFGRTGLTAQRNQALEKALGSSDVVSFFDDDFLPARDYLETVERLLERHPDWKVVHGRVALDGVRGPGYTVAEGLAALARAEAEKLARPAIVTEHPGAYGCNMSMRAAEIADHRFDERLVLYGWQEDIDFTRRVARSGRIVRTSDLLGVHLGIRSGRLSGVRLGYSQMVNPVYLVRKGTMPLRFACELLGRNLAANLVRSVRPEPYIDRRGRLKGNLVALSHLLRGRIEPEYILRL